MWQTFILPFTSRIVFPLFIIKHSFFSSSEVRAPVVDTPWNGWGVAVSACFSANSAYGRLQQWRGMTLTDQSQSSGSVQRVDGKSMSKFEQSSVYYHGRATLRQIDGSLRQSYWRPAQRVRRQEARMAAVFCARPSTSITRRRVARYAFCRPPLSKQARPIPV